MILPSGLRTNPVKPDPCGAVVSRRTLLCAIPPHLSGAELDESVGRSTYGKGLLCGVGVRRRDRSQKVATVSRTSKSCDETAARRLVTTAQKPSRPSTGAQPKCADLSIWGW